MSVFITHKSFFVSHCGVFVTVVMIRMLNRRCTLDKFLTMITIDSLEVEYKSLSFFPGRGGSIVKLKDVRFEVPLASLAPFKTLGEVKENVHTNFLFFFFF